MIDKVKKVSKPKKTTLIEIKSIRQLKFWLQGIQEFQTEKWVPNPAQWDRIYNIIMNLDDIVEQTPQAQHINGPQIQQPASLYSDVQHVPLIQNAVGFDQPPEVNMPISEVRKKYEHSAPSAGVVGNGGILIDSSGGKGYQSGLV